MNGGATWTRHVEDAIEGEFRKLWNRPPHQPSPPAPAATATIEPDTQEEPVNLSADLHALATRLESFDEDALAKLEAVKGSPLTADAFEAVAGLVHVDPSPALTAVIAALKAFAPAPAAPADPGTEDATAGQPQNAPGSVQGGVLA